MDKAILVIDMPYSCDDCPLCYGNDISDWCLVMGHFRGDVWGHTTNHTKPDWCPLRPAPEKYDVLAAIENNPNYDPSYDVGRNDCIDEILGQ